MIDSILKNGFAYEANGSVYFDVEKYNKKFNYGKLSGRNLDDIKTNTRTLDGQDEKKNSFDFAFGKKQHRNILCDGLQNGAMDFRDGIWNVRQ